MSNAAQCRTAGQQDEHKIPADRRTSSSSSSRQAGRLLVVTDRLTRRVEKGLQMIQGKR
jgi:hypothetical protein